MEDPLEAYMSSLAADSVSQVAHSGPTLAEVLHLRRQAPGADAAVPEGKGRGRLDDRMVTSIVTSLSDVVDHVGHAPAEGTASLQSRAQKHDLLTELIARDPAVFLQRYGRLLPAEHVDAFRALDDYEVRWHLQALGAASKQHVRNRRYAQALQMLKASEYFGEEAMRERAPRLAEQLLGPAVTGTQPSFSSMLRRSAENTRRREAGEDSDSEVDEAAPPKPTPLRHDGAMVEELGDDDGEEGDVKMTEAEDEAEGSSLERMQRIMMRRFIDGADDAYFDYATVDNNVALDGGPEVAADSIEAYFRNA